MAFRTSVSYLGKKNVLKISISQFAGRCLRLLVHDPALSRTTVMPLATVQGSRTKVERGRALLERVCVVPDCYGVTWFCIASLRPLGAIWTSKLFSLFSLRLTRLKKPFIEPGHNTNYSALLRNPGIQLGPWGYLHVHTLKSTPGCSAVAGQWPQRSDTGSSQCFILYIRMAALMRDTTIHVWSQDFIQNATACHAIKTVQGSMAGEDHPSHPRSLVGRIGLSIRHPFTFGSVAVFPSTPVKSSLNLGLV
jgi:hypothetical protein